ncbi:MAG: GH116 family glycosyl-hydrolase, partial [Planctomycetota bacterium]
MKRRHTLLFSITLISFASTVALPGLSQQSVQAAAIPELESILAQLSDDSAGKTPTLKKFDPDWVRSLDRRGEPRIYTRKNTKNFEYIGMPIGGIAAGQLYLGGDGKLWFWDIFNTNRRIGDIKGVEAYQYPYRRSRLDEKGIVRIEQDFALRVRWDGHNKVLTLDRDGFREIEFKGQYPVAYVTYSDENMPVTVELEAFSPFIPLDLENSICPATILNYKLTNTINRPVEAELLGRLENAVCLQTRKTADGVLENCISKSNGLTLLQCTARSQAPTDRPRKDIVFEDFEKPEYDGWTIEGTACTKPNHHQQPLGGYHGKGLADSFHNDGDARVSAAQADRHTGKLTSRPFT